MCGGVGGGGGGGGEKRKICVRASVICWNKSDTPSYRGNSMALKIPPRDHHFITFFSRE